MSAFGSLWRRLTGHARPHILFIDDWLPDPRLGAGTPRALAFMRAIMAAGYRLTLLPTASDPAHETAVARLLGGAEVLNGYGRSGIGTLLSERKDFGLVVISRPHNMKAFRAAVANAPHWNRVPVVYDAEALFATRESLRRQVLGLPSADGQAAREISEEVALAGSADMIMAVSENTARDFVRSGHPNVRVLRYAIAPRPTAASFGQRDGFVFVGPTVEHDSPNTDSIIWFIGHVLPRIRREMNRRVPFVLAGKQSSPVIAGRSPGDLLSLGAVSDLEPIYSKARVFVAPTRFAAGIPVKVYDAAAHGVPVVLTPVLAAQLGWQHEEEALVAESPEDFAAQCLRLHGDQALWDRLRARALRRVTQDCDPRQFDRTVLKALEDARRQRA